MCAVAVRPPPPAGAADPISVAQSLLAQDGGASTDWQLVYQRSARVAETGELLWTGKLVNVRTGELRIVYRAPDGAVGGPELLAARVDAAVEALPALAAKGDAALRTAVAASAPATSLAVAVWLDADPAAAEAAVTARHPEVTWIDGRPIVDDLATVRQLRGELWEARRATYRAVEDAFAARVQASGGRVAYASTSAPLVFIDLPAGRVAELAAEPTVDSIGLEGSWKPAMSTARIQPQISPRDPLDGY